MLLVLIAALAVSVRAGEVYLSIFGDNSNDGLSPGTPVATLQQAYNVLVAKKFSQITVMPGSYPLPSLTITQDFTLVGTKNKPLLTKFSCATTRGSGTLTFSGNAKIFMESLSFEACQNPVALGSTSSSVTVSAQMYNVLFHNNNKDIYLSQSRTDLLVNSCEFEGTGTSAISTYKYYNSAVTHAVTVFNSKFIDTVKGTTLDFNSRYNSNYNLNLNLTQTSFQTKLAATGSWLNMPSSAMKLTAKQVLFDGRKSSSCGVAISGATVNMNKVTFQNQEGAPALCIAGSSKTTVIDSTFTKNLGLTKQGAAVYVSNAVFAASNTLFKSNTMKSVGEGAGIHCENSKLTVGSSTLQYNSAPQSAGSSCQNCVVVAFSNTENYNKSGKKGGDPCNL